ncbi:acyltransferase family protein [Micromonospora sp. DT231]|uniref:acyltransferase family protein n=1 Tax=Micromonospora sp. DT231 TaxID=3416526 RepID=UPI003CFB8D0B
MTATLPTNTPAPALEPEPGPRNEPAPPPTSVAPPRLYALDLLRFGAAMAVVLYHTLPVVALRSFVSVEDLVGHPLAKLSAYGWLGVQLFFLISGFVICMSSWGRGPTQFFTSRVTRLMPAYVLAVLITAAVLTLWPDPGPNAHPVTMRRLLANLTMYQFHLGQEHIDPVYWTLVIEVTFYVLFLGLVVAGLTYKRVVAFCLVWTVASFYAQASHSALLSTVLVPTYAPFFVAGIVLYLMHRFGRNLMLWMTLAVTFALAAQSVIEETDARSQRGDQINSTNATLALVAFYVVMIGVACGWFDWIRWRGLVLVGALTYPLYLLHDVIGATIARETLFVLGPYQMLAVTLGGPLLLAYLVYRLWERPAARWIGRNLRSSFAQMRAQGRPRS